MDAQQNLAGLCEASGTTFILALFVDLNGKPCAKLVPVEAVEQLSTEGVGFAGYAVGAIGQEPKDPDIMAVPDPASFTSIPFVKPGLAVVHCDPHVEGEPWPFAPRVILKRLVAQAASAGYTPYAGAEVEYFLLRRDAAGALVPADADDTASQPCYDARGVTRMYDHLSAISTAMNSLGWGNYANDHEDGNGQFEQNFHYADALTTADRVITLRYLLNVMAHERGMIATFMPKPFGNRTGSGLHLHLSLRDAVTDVPVFPGSEDTADGLGLSKVARSFVAGILEHATALQAVIAPTVNSYKRTGAVASSASGATWAPKLPTYGGNDRTHYVRVPDDQRVELRGGDGSANPYLAIAAALGAGLDGVAGGAVLGELGSGPGTPFPATLLHAVEAFEADPVVRGVMDAVGPGVSDYFASLKRTEFFDYHASVSEWETDRYLTAF
ncbi:type III glutamate--ammonia ligase [Nocardioides sp. IC4_145]|uniref:type III glutamate--ammonia ligase n=1 Tax=Nocardioides sp. IC4_145 TaxID=2714037 RepID=UPI0014079752|nr:type III glutamate--ammonia ligase [Nocardioides sp. IC4_145]NHC24339.1 type III glutamate--ammonia ligase [Nocardioides sp. IC4_145]